MRALFRPQGPREIWDQRSFPGARRKPQGKSKRNHAGDLPGEPLEDNSGDNPGNQMEGPFVPSPRDPRMTPQKTPWMDTRMHHPPAVRRSPIELVSIHPEDLLGPQEISQESPLGDPPGNPLGDPLEGSLGGPWEDY